VLFMPLLWATATGGVHADGDTENAVPAKQASADAHAGANEQAEGQASNAQTTKSQPLADEKRGQWVLAPIPINSPAIGAGLEWVAARVFPLNKEDRISPPSSLGIGGVFTNNGSRAVAAGGRLYLKEDKYRLATGIGGASVNLDVYGVDSSGGDRGVFIPLTTEGGLSLESFSSASRRTSMSACGDSTET
jgi:hypothetical protein